MRDLSSTGGGGPGGWVPPQISPGAAAAPRLRGGTPRGGTSPNPPRAGMQQGQVSSSRYAGCPRVRAGPDRLRVYSRWAASRASTLDRPLMSVTATPPAAAVTSTGVAPWVATSVVKPAAPMRVSSRG